MLIGCGLAGAQRAAYYIGTRIRALKRGNLGIILRSVGDWYSQHHSSEAISLLATSLLWQLVQFVIRIVQELVGSGQDAGEQCDRWRPADRRAGQWQTTRHHDCVLRLPTKPDHRRHLSAVAPAQVGESQPHVTSEAIAQSQRDRLFWAMPTSVLAASRGESVSAICK